jgi:hypothetical protein
MVLTLGCVSGGGSDLWVLRFSVLIGDSGRVDLCGILASVFRDCLVLEEWGFGFCKND